MTRSAGPGLVFFDICFDSLDKVFYAGENIKGQVKFQLERPKIVKTQRNSTQLNSTQSNCKSNFVG